MIKKFFIFILFYSAINAQPIENMHFGSYGNPLNGLTITWKSPGENDIIKWGYTDKYEIGEFPGVRRANYEGYLFDYTFPILKPNRNLYYSIYNSKENNFTDKIFITASDTLSKTFTFTIAGDSRTRLNRWTQIAKIIEKSDFNLFLGDVVGSGINVYDWDNWFYFGEKFTTNNLIYHTLGNHDKGDNHYENLFVLPSNPNGNELYYTFDYGNSVFICLNSENARDTVQYIWLKNVLEKSKDKIWTFLFFHRPFYSSAGHPEDMHKYFNTWWKLFDDYGVDFIFAGHSHHYERTKPINRNISIEKPVSEYGSLPDQGRCQIVSGGAGAPLYYPKNKWFTEVAEAVHHYCKVTVDSNVLKFEAIDKDGKVIDSLLLNKKVAPFGPK